MIFDGQSKFKCSLLEFMRRPSWLDRMSKTGIKLPAVEDVATEAAPALARVNYSEHEGQTRWIADCPDCMNAMYVWIRGPHLFFCADCLNASIGHRWRVVTVPRQWRRIEQALGPRPLKNQHWMPGETVAALLAENEAHGVAA